MKPTEREELEQTNNNSIGRRTPALLTSRLRTSPKGQLCLELQGILVRQGKMKQRRSYKASLVYRAEIKNKEQLWKKATAGMRGFLGPALSPPVQARPIMHSHRTGSQHYSTCCHMQPGKPLHIMKATLRVVQSAGSYSCMQLRGPTPHHGQDNHHIIRRNMLPNSYSTHSGSIVGTPPLVWPAVFSYTLPVNNSSGV